MKLLFIDIDGVLSQSSTLDHAPVAQLNRVIVETGAACVISSAWRYIIGDGDMTLKGFAYMLRTHGVIDSVVIENYAGGIGVDMDESHWADVIESIEHIYMTMRRAQACDPGTEK